VISGSESTREEYAARMNRVVDYIQAHLSEPLDLNRIAAVACFSPFHFHRLFAAWMGETLQTFVQRLRLEHAAQTLVFDRTKSVSDIALDCGFASAGTFARSFKGAFRMSASEYRKSKKCQANRNPGEADQGESLSFSKAPGPTARRKENPMTRPSLNVRTVNLSSQTIAYLRHIGPYKGDAALFRRLFEKLFAWAGPRGLLGPDMRYLSVMQDNPNLTPAAKQRLEVALVVPAGTAPNGDIGVRTLNGGLYATAQVYVPIEEYAAQWDALLADWLPGSGYQPDNRPALEFYLNNPDEDPDGKFRVEICIPVRPL
jgi:AraC family transcriptional regulator